jgi:uncharacterized protein (TIGR03084 family)
MQQADDFRLESEALHALVEPLSDIELERATAFKGWTINTVLRHLHVWNQAAGLSLAGGGRFATFFEKAAPHVAAGTMPSFELEFMKGLTGPALVETWRRTFVEVARRFADADPSMRVEWAGPGMSARSSVTARLMETWAHGQAVYDALGVVRVSGDRIRNIVVLGFNTYAWTFKVNRLEAPTPVPCLRLIAPSGEIWSHGEPSEVESVEGSAEEFCQVVTQTRNVTDTKLRVLGPNATAWMRMAQCFAGRAERPPAPGTRETALR